MFTSPIRNFDDIEALTLWRPDAYGTKAVVEDTDGNFKEFVYAYTALTSLLKGGCIALTQDTGAAAGQNPRATVPITAGIIHKFGIAAETVTAAGGIWVQTYGVCDYARVDGGSTDVAVGDYLKPVNTKQYLIFDHATVPTASAVAVGASVEAAAVGAQTDTTNGDADNTVFLIDRWATVA